ncbi:MAG: transglutaminase TgpA family protein [Thermoanaerobaculia bacterium]
MRRAPEVEMILLTAVAAVPLYVTNAISPLVVFAFHVILAAAALAIRSRRSLARMTAVGRFGAIVYLPFFFLDALVLSRSLIEASVHLLFFIAIYQTLDETARAASGQRVLVTFLIFLTSLATATHQSVMIFVLAFTLLMFGRLIRASHETTAEELGREAEPMPVLRSAAGFALPTVLLAIALFPMLPRTQNPFVRGIPQRLESTSTGISETIDFRENRRISDDPLAVARVWMARDAVPFFTPLRLRLMVYDGWEGGEWRPLMRETGDLVSSATEEIAIARPAGYSRVARIEQKRRRNRKLILPEGTYEIRGFNMLRVVDYYATAFHTDYNSQGEQLRGEFEFEVEMSRQTRPLLARPAAVPAYPYSPAVRAMAERIAGGESGVRERARAIEQYLVSEFAYLADPSELGRPVTVNQFLLETRRGHCEYFAAGMVALLSALDIPARIVGGYYGGELNPLIGSFIIRERDAHAWVEVFDGESWVTFDPTPPAERPGTGPRNLARAYASAIRDAVAYFWDRYILTFGSADQVELALRALYAARDSLAQIRSNLSGAAGEMRENLWVIVLPLALVAAIVALILATRRRSEYEKLLAILREMGIPSDASTAPQELLARVRELRPELVEHVAPIVDAYLVDRFSPHPPPESLRARAKRALRELAAQ